MADARRLVELGAVPGLAREIAAQIDAGVGDKRRLIELAVVPRLALEIANQITAKIGDKRRLVELGVVGRLASELATQIQGGGVVPKVSTFKIFGETNANAASADRTRPISFVRNRPWKRVKVHVFGINAASGLKVTVAPSAHVNTNPYTPSGGMAAFQVAPLAQNSFPASAVPASGAASAVPSVVSSDWMDLPSIPRTDGGSGYILMARCYQDAASSGLRASHATGTPPSDVDTYDYWVGNTVVGDFTQTVATFSTDTNGFPIFFEFEDDTAPIQIAFIGPSTIQGRDNFGLKIRPSSWMAVEELRAEGRDVEWCQYGWNGASTSGETGMPPASIAGYWGQFLNYMTKVGSKPDIVAFMPASGNNTNFMGASGVAESDYWCGVFADWCAANGKRGILVTPTPRGNGTSGNPVEAQETFRRQIAANIKTIAANRGLGVIDLDSLTNYASPTGGWIDPAYSIADGVHESTAGSAAEKPLVKAALIQALNSL